MSKNIFITCLVLVAFQLNTFSQSQPEESVKDSTISGQEVATMYKKTASFASHLRFGGGLQAGFGNNYTTIGISPSVLYDFYNGLLLGVGANYYHSSNKDFDYTSNVYGGSLISYYNLLRVIQLSAEYELLNVNSSNGSSDSNYWTNGLYAGIAYRRKNMSIGIRYDLLFDDQKSIYGESISPVVRIYF